MSYETVLVERKENYAVVTFNRPEKFNAITERMPANLAEAVERAGDDDSVHVIVLTGAGRGFCGGYDLEVFAEGVRSARQREIGQGVTVLGPHRDDLLVLLNGQPAASFASRA